MDVIARPEELWQSVTYVNNGGNPNDQKKT